MNSPKPTEAAPAGLLTSTLARPMDKMNLGNDVAAINALTGFLNSPLLETAVPDSRNGEMSAAEAMLDTTPTAESQAAQVAANPLLRKPSAPAQATASANVSAPSPLPVSFDKFFMTGRLCSGKDYVAAQTGASIEGFSRPLYALAEYFFGVPVDANSNKDLPGMRAFLQAAGQWGRCRVSAAYPLTPARAVFCSIVRSHAADFDPALGVDWEAFGRSENIWLDAALVRIATAGASRNAITGTRFANEFKRLTEEGWVNWHVMTTPVDWHARLAKRGIKPDAPVLKDESEQLAASLDAQVIKEISRSKTGAKLRVVWNSNAPLPSPRLFTVAEFLKAANVVAAPGATEDFILNE